MQKRINPNYVRVEKKHQRHISNDVMPKKILRDELLSLQENISRKPITIRENELRILLEKSYFQKRKIKDAAKLSEIYYQAILIFIDVGNYTLAREIAYTQIQTMVRWSEKSSNFLLKKYIFQPWILLIKIDRLEGKTHDALKKLKTLTDDNQAELIVGENKLWRKSLFDALYQAGEMYRDIMTQGFVEKIQLHLSEQRYHETFNLIQNNKLSTKLTDGVIQETCAIMYANSGKINEAFTVLAEKNERNPIAKRILNLREYEMRARLVRDEATMIALNKLYYTSADLIRSGNAGSQDIIFALHTCRVMEIMGMTMNVSKLIYFCLEAAINLKDELLKAECLIMLHGLTMDSKAKKILEDLMIKHYHQTQYLAARKKMLSCMEDLKYVETKNSDQTLKPLFEDIMALSYF